MTRESGAGRSSLPATVRPRDLRCPQDCDPVEFAAQEGIQTLARGGLVVLHDDRNDQGDLLAPGQLATAETVNTMVRRAGGLVSVVLTGHRARDLGLRPVPQRNFGARRDCERTPSMVSVEARQGVSTGISCADRARTIATLAGPRSEPRDLVSPGHIFPIVAADGGLLERYGRLEAAVDAVRLAGLEPVAVLCDVLDENGDLVSGRGLLELAHDLGAPLVTVSELVEMRCEEAWNRC